MLYPFLRLQFIPGMLRRIIEGWMRARGTGTMVIREGAQKEDTMRGEDTRTRDCIWTGEDTRIGEDTEIGIMEVGMKETITSSFKYEYL